MKTYIEAFILVAVIFALAATSALVVYTRLR